MNMRISDEKESSICGDLMLGGQLNVLMNSNTCWTKSSRYMRAKETCSLGEKGTETPVQLDSV